MEESVDLLGPVVVVFLLKSRIMESISTDYKSRAA